MHVLELVAGVADLFGQFGVGDTRFLQRRPAAQDDPTTVVLKNRYVLCLSSPFVRVNNLTNLTHEKDFINAVAYVANLLHEENVRLTKASLLEEIAKSHGRCQASRNIGIDRNTILRTMNKDRDFALAVERAEMQAAQKKQEMALQKKLQRKRERQRKEEIKARLRRTGLIR